MRKLSRVLLFIVAGQVYCNSEEKAPMVTIDDGTMKGSKLNLLDDGEYYSFKGIPYAQPPVGDLRFRDPLPPNAWDGERDATKHGPICIQVDKYDINIKKGSEDCLFLNVYTKSLEPTAKYPVMVFIHGGSFMTGSGDSDSYGPEFLLQHDVIVVTINYRLEVLGFLSLDTPEVPGNAGLKDQVAALKWVKHNIAKFGGDPDKVTIFGESAGAAAVAHHLVSPMSKGLFHRAIAQSGSCISDWAMGKFDLERAFRVGEVLGKKFESKEEIYTYLKSVPAITLAGISLKNTSAHKSFSDLFIDFNPIAETEIKDVEAFLNEHSLESLVSCKVNKVPLMIGYTSGEGILFYNKQKMEEKSNDTKYFVPKEIASRVSDEKCRKIGQRIKEFYFGDKSFSNETIEAFVNYLTDSAFAYNIHRFGYFYTACEQLVYSYRFNFDTELNYMKKMVNIKNISGASHVDDIFYLFYNNMNKDIYKNQGKLRHIVDKLTKIWTSFAKTGNPTPDDNHGGTWNQLNSDHMVMNLEEPMSMGPNPDNDRLKFWNDLYCESEAPCL